MIVNYFGEGSFRLQSGETVLLVNPANNRQKGDVTLRTLTLTNDAPLSGIEIAFPGEYEIKGIEIKGLLIEKESSEKFLKTAYAVTWEDMKFVFLGHLSKFPDPELIEAIEEPDVLFIPTGDAHFIGASEAAKLIKQLEPAIVVPAFYKNSAEFLKAMGQKGETEEKLVFKKKDLEGRKGRVVVLEAKG